MTLIQAGFGHHGAATSQIDRATVPCSRLVVLYAAAGHVEVLCILHGYAVFHYLDFAAGHDEGVGVIHSPAASTSCFDRAARHGEVIVVTHSPMSLSYEKFNNQRTKPRLPNVGV